MDIFLTTKSSGERVYFMAQSWTNARTKASELAGKRHRGIYIIPTTHHLHPLAVSVLGLNVN